MKRELLRTLVAGGILAMYSTFHFSDAQGYLFYETFDNFPNHIPGGQNSGGWTTKTIQGDSSVDRWFFNNYIGYDVPVPLEGKVAVADAYNGGYTNTLTNNSNLHELELISPVVSTVGMSNLTLTFDELFMQLGSAVIEIDVSTNNGSTWTNVNTVTTGGFFSRTRDINLNAYTGNATFQVRFVWNKGVTSPTTHGYWMIDNIRLYTRYVNDVGVETLVDPKNNSCPDAAQPLGLKITNFGTSSASNISVNMSVSGAASGNFSTSIGSLAAGASTTVFTSSTINTTSGGTVNFNAYTAYASDQTTTNDTLITSVVTAPTPTDPSGPPVVRCGVGPVNLQASAQSGEFTVWYNDSLTNTALGAGNPYTTPFTVYANRRFYAENTRNLPSEHSTYLSGVYRWNTTNNKAIFFDLTAANEVVLDSFASNFAYQGTYIIKVFYKTGTYYGFGTTQSAFTLLATDTVTTTVLGQPAYIDLKNTGLRIGAGETYGFVLEASAAPGSSSPLPEFAFKQGVTNNIANEDISVYGDGVSNVAWSSFVTGYSGDIKIHYQKVCKSQRKGIDVVIIPRPAGVGLIEGAVNNGAYRGGTPANPDVARMNDTFMYELTPPNSYTNAEFGTKWYVTDFSFETLTGNGPVPSDTMTTVPGAAPGTFRFIPSTAVDTVYKITVTVLDIAKNCDTTVTRYLMVGADPKAGFSVSAICEGDAATFNNTSNIASGSMDFMWYFGDGDSSDIANPTHTYAMSGTYNVQLVAISNFGFRSVYDSTVQVYEIPGANFTVPNVCDGASHSFTDASYIPPIGSPVFSWDFGDGSALSNAQNPTHTYTNPGIYKVLLLVNVNGCTDERTRYVTLAPRAVPDFSSQTSCNNKQAVFTNSTTLQFGNFGSSWKYGDGTSGTGQNPMHLYNGFGSFDVRLLITTDLGCVDSIIKQVSLIESPKADFSMSSVCSGEEVKFTNLTNTPGGGGSNGYIWDFGNGMTSFNDDPSTVYTGPGVYTIKLRADAGNGCGDSLVRVVTIDTKPIAGLSANNVCEGEVTKFVNSTVNIQTGSTWIWDFDNGVQSTARDTAFIYAMPGAYDVTLYVSSPNGCLDTAGTTVSVFEMPNAGFTASTAQLGDGTIFFQGPGGAGYSYLWFMGDGEKYNTKDVTHRYQLSGNFEAKLVVTTNEGCTDMSTQWVAVFPTGVEDPDNRVTLYPNPSKGSFTISLEQEVSDANLTITDMNGKALYTTRISGATANIDLGNIAPGVYLVQVFSGELSYTAKLEVLR